MGSCCSYLADLLFTQPPPPPSFQVSNPTLEQEPVTPVMRDASPIADPRSPAPSRTPVPDDDFVHV